MKRILPCFILAGVVAGMIGCRAEPASHVAAEMDRGVNSTEAIGSGEARVAPATQMAAQARARGADTRPLIVCFGDSLTAGYGADEGESYPDFLQKDLDRDGYRYRVVNEGISGNTTKDGVDRLAGIVAMKPAVVVLEFGGNDGLRGLQVQTTRANLATMITGLKQAGVRVLLAGITLPPDYGPDYVNAFTAIYPLLARKYEVAVLPFIYKDVYGLPGMIQADGIHATDKGNEAVAKNVVPLVEPLLRK